MLTILDKYDTFIFMNYKTIDSRNNKRKEVLYQKRHKFVQALVCPDIHKALRRLALEQDITLGELLQEIIQSYLTRRYYAKGKEIN